MEPDNKLHDVVMIGAGPSALAAAVYTTREEVDTVLLEQGVVGGLAAITDWVDNYPGFTNNYKARLSVLVLTSVMVTWSPSTIRATTKLSKLQMAK